eukprot:2404424-Pyramimonas_sp.AAC.1
METTAPLPRALRHSADSHSSHGRHPPMPHIPGAKHKRPSKERPSSSFDCFPPAFASAGSAGADRKPRARTADKWAGFPATVKGFPGADGFAGTAGFPGLVEFPGRSVTPEKLRQITTESKRSGALDNLHRSLSFEAGPP